MKKYIILLIIIYTFSGYSQKIEWAKAEAYPSFVSHKNFVVNDKRKNTYILGDIRYAGAGIFFIKYDLQGNKVWEKHYKGAGAVSSMAVDSTGFIYISICVFKLTINDVEYANNDGGGTCLLIKYDTNGNIVWLKRNYHGILLSEVTNSQNNLTISGVAIDTIYLENNNTLYPYQGGHSLYIAKLNTNGECISSSQVVGSKSKPLKIISNGSMYASDDFSSNSITLGKSNKITLYKTSGMGFCAKYDKDDELVYVKQLNTDLFAPDEFGNAYAFVTEPYAKGGLIYKYDKNGNLLWKRTSIYIDEWYKVQMKCSDKGDLYITGGFRNYMTIGDTTINANGNTRAFVTKFDSTGKMRWLITSGGLGGAGVKDLTIKGDEIYITGDLGGDNTFGEFAVSANGEGTFVAKIIDRDITLSTGKNVVVAQNIFEIYPNPAGKVFTLSYISTQTNKDLQINIIDMSGKTVYTETVQVFNGKLKKEINLGSVAKGTYIIELSSLNMLETKKIVIE